MLPLLALSAGAVENEINGVNVVPADGKVRIEISKAGNVTFNAFTMSEPDRLVINCVGAKYNVPWQVKDVESPIVSKVRTSQFQLDPLVISRVVLDLSTAVDYQMWAEGENAGRRGDETRARGAPRRGQESAALCSRSASRSRGEEGVRERAPGDADANRLIAQASMGPFLPYVPKSRGEREA